MAVSGGLYLSGIKGSFEKGETIFVPAVQIDADQAKESQVKEILQQAGLDADFEYVKDRGRLMQTRPTSRDYFELEPTADGMVSPDLVASLMELHKGHGPGLFRILEQITALGLILILISGLIIGLKSPLLKKPTIGLTAAGILVFVILAAVL